MAKQILERILDDLDGSEGAASIEFGLDGVMYTIDLNEKHQDELRATLEPFLASARRERRLAAGRGARRPAPGTGDRDRNQAIRAWALENGIELATRGRIAQGVLDAFDNSDVDALYAAVGIERAAAETPKRGRRKAAGLEFSEPNS